uniref:HBXBP30 n=1 Tax=Homo sapiens TaxID=9606 RepID=Q7Z576_HUMAN|nr:HBXBP30 [Homo sapiens]
MIDDPSKGKEALAESGGLVGAGNGVFFPSTEAFWDGGAVLASRGLELAGSSVPCCERFQDFDLAQPASLHPTCATAFSQCDVECYSMSLYFPLLFLVMGTLEPS